MAAPKSQPNSLPPRTPHAAPTYRAWHLWGCLALVTIFYFPLLTSMFDKWWNDPDYTHAIMVIPISLWLVWRQRAELKAMTPNGHWSGLLFIVAGLAACLLSLPGQFDYPARSAIIPILLGVVILFLGYRFVRKLLFPILFLIFMVPIPNILYSQLAMPLQKLAADNAVRTLNNIGIPTIGMGNVIKLKSGYTMEVASACSGIRSLLAMTCLASLTAHLLQPNRWVGLFLFLYSVPLAIVLNVFRVTATGKMAQIDTTLAEGMSHEVWGFVTFGLALGGLFLTSRLIDWIFKPLAVADETDQAMLA